MAKDLPALAGRGAIIHTRDKYACKLRCSLRPVRRRDDERGGELGENVSRSYNFVRMHKSDLVSMMSMLI